MINRYFTQASTGLLALLVVAPWNFTAAQGVRLRDSVEIVPPARPLLSTALSASVAAKEAEAAATKAIADAEAEARKQLERLRALEKDYQTFRFGLSLGWRHNVTKSVVRDVAINPADNVLVVDKIDRGAFVLSGVVAAHPWRNPVLLAPEDSSRRKTFLQRNAWRFGFIANLNLAEFGPSSIQSFNKSIEGGLGATMKLNEEFAFAAVFERLFGRNLRSFVVPGQVLNDKDGNAVTSLSKDDNTYFRDDNMTTLSFKFVYYIK